MPDEEVTPLALDVGNGRVRTKGFKTVDKIQFIDGNGNECVDVLCDVETEALPFEDSTVDLIRVDNVLEHLADLRHALNEFHRVLKPETGQLVGIVPVAGSEPDYQDPTHQRHFIVKTFEYFVGSSPAKPEAPGHPRYADYGFKPWVHTTPPLQEGDLIHFDMTPRK